eukprot:1105893-Rhodomonas_salina.2
MSGTAIECGCCTAAVCRCDGRYCHSVWCCACSALSGTDIAYRAARQGGRGQGSIPPTGYPPRACA